MKKIGESSLTAKLLGFLTDSVLTRVRELASTQVNALFDVIEVRTQKLVKRVLRDVAVASLIGVGALCLLLAAVFFLIDVLHWPRYMVFAAASALLLLGALFLRRE